LASLETVTPAESDETYVLSRTTDASVKVRDGLLDVKVLTRIDGSGLQLWVPTLKAPFPLDTDATVTAFEALGVPAPSSPPPDLAGDEAVDGLVGSRDDLRAVHVHKSRRRSLLDGCMVELTDLIADGRHVRTVAVESADPDLVVATVRHLGLEGRPNTCVAKGLKSLLGWGPARYAVLDVGTNSVKFLQGVRDGDEPRTVLDTAEVTRLGEGLVETGSLTPAAMGRTVDAIADLVARARRDGPVEIVAVGTAGLRQAPNRDAFVEAVHARCGVVVQVIPGAEEARLAYLAAVSSLPLAGDDLLVFDSGGGSSQFTWGSPAAIEEQFSLDVGAVRFTERFGLADAVPGGTVEAARAAIAADLSRLHGRSSPDMVIAIGGTATNLAAVQHGLARYDPEVVHGTVVGLDEVERQIEEYRQRSADERRAVRGLQPARAEVILAGACIVGTIMAVTGQDRVTVSDRGLRHGVVAERFAPRSL
jgi:exopolyphosphatase/guanosine-5'-triphosphate,3'-diphosphate pyrophosphatase